MGEFEAPDPPGVSVGRGTLHVLRSIKERGLENIWSETAMLARGTRAAVEALGMTVFARDYVDSVTAMVLPDGIDEPSLRKTMRSKYGFQVAGGQGELKGKIIRFSHMGYIDAFDTLGAIGALEMALAAQGHKFTTGAGISAAQAVFMDAMK